jgi:hypothetical protein
MLGVFLVLTLMSVFVYGAPLISLIPMIMTFISSSICLTVLLVCAASLWHHVNVCTMRKPTFNPCLPQLTCVLHDANPPSTATVPSACPFLHFIFAHSSVWHVVVQPVIVG